MALSDKLAVVTGGASGLGKAVCELFAKEGANVVVADINIDGAKTVAATLAGGSDNHFAHGVDVSSSASVKSLADAILAKYGKPPNVVISAAGIMIDVGLVSVPEEIFDKTININLKGTYLVNTIFMDLMKEHKVHGSIVNFSSIASTGHGKMPAYSASKGGVDGFTSALAMAAAKDGIRVNAVRPGVMNTPLVEKQPLIAEMMKRRPPPMNRMGEPSEVAELCLFLASDKSSYMTGSLVKVTGGIPG